MDYAIETLKIEKYRQISLERQVEINEHEARTSFGSREIIGRIKRLDEAIARIEGAIKDTQMREEKKKIKCPK